MSIPRSQSAPNPISQSCDKGKGAASGPKRGAAIARSQTSVDTWRVPAKSVYGSRRVERKDPFSLSTFFPGQLANEEEWGWLNERNGLYDGEMEAVVVPEEGVGGIMLGKAEDELAGASIKGEDKLGVLGLDGILPEAGLMVTGFRDMIGL